MVDEPTFERLLRDIYNGMGEMRQSMGRIEQKVGGLDEKVDEVKVTAKENTKERDRLLSEQNVKLDAIRVRQADDAHAAANVQQVMVGQIEAVQKSVGIVDGKVGVLDGKVEAQDKRIGALEAPIKKALAARQQRTMALAKMAAIGAAVVSFLWIALQPIWNVLADVIAHRIAGGLTPH